LGAAITGVALAWHRNGERRGEAGDVAGAVYVR